MNIKFEEDTILDETDIYSEKVRLLEEENDELEPWEEAWMKGYDEAM